MAKRSAPEVNAGSMADIAFLLLIFFLVTTDIATDSGLNRKLPPKQDEKVTPPVIKERNIFVLNVNSKDEMLMTRAGEEKRVLLKDLRKEVVTFLENGGGTGKDACKYCDGKKDSNSSDNYLKAVVSLSNDRLTKYKTYISVQNEVIAAYNEVRNKVYRKVYPKSEYSFVEDNARYLDPATDSKVKAKLKVKLENVKTMVPQIFSESDAKKSN